MSMILKRLIIDTNQIISSLIKDSYSRKILLSPYFEFISPDYVFHEINQHRELIQKKSGLNDYEFDFVFDILFSHIEIIPIETIRKCFDRAREIMDPIDPGDTVFIALGLCVDNDGIWTNDKHFLEQNILRVWTTKELLELLENKNNKTGK